MTQNITSILPSNSIWDFQPFQKSKKNNPSEVLIQIQKIYSYSVQLKLPNYNAIGKQKNEYGEYLQFGNKKVKTLALEITKGARTNDEKALKILNWVRENIPYKTDEKNYGKGEFWALPTETLLKKSGDCEDQAFLIHSLALNAGIPWENLKTYGGLVSAGTGAATGGHGWTVYKRESDNEWIALDACYYYNDKLIEERIPLKEDKNYIDDWFFVNLTQTVDTSFSNTLKGGRVNIYG